MTASIREIQQVLQRFQDGYIERDLSKLDDFMELFVRQDDIELIGIGATARNQKEWLQGTERVREFIESDGEGFPFLGYITQK